jgi:hypothetical protein
MLDEGEACDGSEFGGKDCSDFGLSGGNLLCNDHCAAVLTQCMPKESCSNKFDDDQDGSTDCEDDDCATIAACLDSCTGAIALNSPAIEYGSTIGLANTLTPSCHTSSGSEVVYSFVAGADATFGVEIFSFLGPMALSVRSDCGLANTEIACSAAAAFTQAIEIEATQGTTYYVIVDAQSGQADDFEITLEQKI